MLYLEADECELVKLIQLLDNSFMILKGKLNYRKHYSMEYLLEFRMGNKRVTVGFMKELNALEIKGLLTDEEYDFDSVASNLKAEEVFERIKDYYIKRKESIYG